MPFHRTANGLLRELVTESFSGTCRDVRVWIWKDIPTVLFLVPFLLMVSGWLREVTTRLSASGICRQERLGKFSRDIPNGLEFVHFLLTVSGWLREVMTRPSACGMY